MVLLRDQGIRHVVVVVPDGDVISSVDEHAGKTLGRAFFVGWNAEQGSPSC